MPLLHTVGFVVDKLRTGSPLMIPGLARGPPFPENAIANAVVAIASVENPSVPKVVGICEVDISSITQVQGAKGHAVRSEHWEGDELWAWSSSGGLPGGVAPSEIEGWMSQAPDANLFQTFKSGELKDVDEEDGGGVTLDDKVEPQQQMDAQNECVKAADAESPEMIEEVYSTKGRLKPSYPKDFC